MEAERMEEGFSECAEQSLASLFEEQYHGCFTAETPFETYLNQLCAQAGKKRWQVIHRAWIDRTYGYQLFNGTRRPSRDKVIQLAFGLELDLPRTQELLGAAEKNALDPRRKRDAVFIFCIGKRMNLVDVQILLERLGLTPLELMEH